VASSEANQDAASLELGVLTENDLLQELAGPVFQLAEGAVTEALNTALGWHLLKAEEITAGGQKTFAEARDTLKQDVAGEKAIDVMYELSNRLEDELGGGATLEEAARNLSLPVVKVDAIDRAGRDANGIAVSGIADAPAFLDSAFATAEGEDSPLTEAGAEGFFVLRVDGVTAPVLRPLETVRDKVSEAWIAERRGQQAEEKAKAMVERLEGGATLSDLAGELNLSVDGAGPFTRGRPAGLNAALAAKLFDGGVGTAAMTRAEGGYQVAVLTRVEASEPSEDKAGVDEVSSRLASSMRDDLLLQLAEALRTQHGVSVNRRLVDEMFAGTTGQ
jgi:peptidyl-prolyl cis-trans isomerase D